MTDEPADDGPKVVDGPKLDRPFPEFSPDMPAPMEPEDWPAPCASPIDPETMMLAFVAGNFSSAFIQALGQQAAHSFANLSKTKIKKLTAWLQPKRVRRKGQPDEYHIGLKDGATATIVVTEDTPDEARLALLDLDVTAPELRGKELRWDEATGAWRPSGPLPAESDEAR